MAAPNPSVKNVSTIKARLLRPALTSHYECHFDIPNVFPSARQKTVSDFIGKTVPVNSLTNELLTLSCSEASLPGSSLATHELNNDFTGVTQRHVYRRLYDDRADFTFYVNHSYSQIRLFERWMQFISGEQQADSQFTNNSYRVMYPKTYKTTIYITKFERDVQQAKTKLVYSFFNAFPISIASMPVSYDSSQLLKCTVSFSYDRYIAENKAIVGKIETDTTTPEGQSIFNAGNLSAYEPSLGLDLGVQPVDYFNNVAPVQYNQQPNDFLNLGNPTLDQFGVRDPLGRGAEGTAGANILV